MSVLVHSACLHDFVPHVARMRPLPPSPDVRQAASFLAAGWVFRVFPGSPPVFYNVTWKRTPSKSWKMANTSRWEGLWRDLVNGVLPEFLTSVFTPLTCPSCLSLGVLIEFPEAWSWFPWWRAWQYPDQVCSACHHLKASGHAQSSSC